MVQRPSSKLISKRRPAPRLTPKQHCYSRCVEDVLWESELTQFWYIGFQIGLVLPESPPSRFQQFRVFSTEVSCLGYGVSGGRGSLHKGNWTKNDVLGPSPEKKVGYLSGKKIPKPESWPIFQHQFVVVGAVAVGGVGIVFACCRSTFA